MRWTDFKEGQEDQFTPMGRKITKITEKHRSHKAGLCFFVWASQLCLYKVKRYDDLEVKTAVARE
jgi:hypothetical protein